jgi:N-acetyl-1-D-myo-inositol-2-amino-2-deoxy-alpha-D-glucopyranoside deacetylase
LYWTAIPRSFVQTGIERMIEAGNTRFFGVTSADELPFVVDDSLVTTCIRAPELVPQKMAALRAHQTQVEEGGDFFLAFEQIGPEAWGNEFYRLVGGSLFGAAAVGGASGELESDLFAGVK